MKHCVNRSMNGDELRKTSIRVCGRNGLASFLKAFTKLAFSNRKMPVPITVKKLIYRIFSDKVKSLLVYGLEEPLVLDANPAGIPMILRLSNNNDHFMHVFFDKLETWERRPLAKWKKIVQNADTVIDVGSYAGVYSIVAKKVGARRVIAFEPNPEAHEQAKENFRINGNLPIDLWQVALGRSSAQGYLATPIGRIASSGAKVSENNKSLENLNWQVNHRVEIVTLDEVARKESIKDVTAIKIDAEGNELEVLLGGQQLIESQHPAIFVEILDYNAFNSVVQQLRGWGYGDPEPLDGRPYFSASETRQHGTSKVATNYYFTQR